MCGNWSQYFAEIVWHMPISNPGGYHWSMKSCTSCETSIIHSRCSWICSIRFLISRSFISWGFLTRFIFVSIVLRNGHEVIINIYTKDSWINLSTCIWSCFYFFDLIVLCTWPWEDKLGHLLGFWPWIEVLARSLSGNFSLWSEATHSHSCDPIGRWLKTESNNDITLLSRNCWPWLCRLRRALGKTGGFLFCKCSAYRNVGSKNSELRVLAL